MAFYRLTQSSEGQFRDRGSKFFAYAYPVENREEVGELIQALKKQHYDARHWCSAFRIGKKGELVYTNDDGEPSNTAGAPILAAIRSADLTQTLVVVVRYFGGIKLGVRGLIDAYRSAAEDAIQNNKLEEIIPRMAFQIHFPYTSSSAVNQILHYFKTIEIEKSYMADVRLDLAIHEDQYEEIKSRFEQARITFKELGAV